MYSVEIGVARQKWLSGSDSGTLVLKSLRCEAGVVVSLGGVGCNLHLTST